MPAESQIAPLANLGITEVLDSLPDGAYVTDPQRKILFWNEAAERITGWRARDVVGRTCFDNVLCHVDQDGHPLCGQEHCPLHRSIVTGKRSEQPLLVFAQTRGGDRIAVEVSVSPLLDKQGQTIGGIEIFRDMSSQMEDLTRARQIQVGLNNDIPSGDPRVRLQCHIEERDLVGGDLGCIGRYDEHRYAALMLDVRGHGLAAALYTMYLRSQWDDLRADWMDPAAVMDGINARSNALAPDAGYLATAIAVSYDARDGAYALVRAGHPAPLRVTRSMDSIPIGRVQPALGLDAATRYQNDRFRLETGESLFIYSDGAIELLTPEGDELGLEGLQACLRMSKEPELELAAIPERLLVRSGCIRQVDDVTLMSISRLASG